MTSVISTSGLILQCMQCTVAVVTEQTRTEDLIRLSSDDIIDSIPMKQNF